MNDTVNNLTVTGMLYLFPENKAQQRVFVAKLVDSVKSGVADPVRAEAAMANLEQIVRAYRQDPEVRQILIAELEKEGGRILTPDAKVELMETAIDYDYCDSTTWRDLDTQIEELTRRRKAVETALRNATPDTPYLDPATGETITGIGRTSRKTIKVTINKGE